MDTFLLLLMLSSQAGTYSIMHRNRQQAALIILFLRAFCRDKNVEYVIIFIVKLFFEWLQIYLILSKGDAMDSAMLT